MPWLKDYRIKSGLSGDQVAKEVRISQQFYSYIENSQRRPSVDVAKRIAAVLAFDWTRFFEDGAEREDGESA